MLRIAALTSGRDVPSSRFRVRQFLPELAELGIDVVEFQPPFSKYTPAPHPRLGPLWTSGKLLSRAPAVAASWGYDITWLERELIPGKFTLERWAGRRRLLDVDDAIWLANDQRFSERIAECCDGVIVGNSYLADHYRPIASRVWIVPTSVDTARWTPLCLPDEKRTWTIGWTGSAPNLPYLLALEEALANFLSDHTDSELLVVCDQKPSFSRIPSNRWRFEAWSPEHEVAHVQRMDVGLMPLPESAWSRGKCALKMLLTMAVGRPVVVSPIGANLEVLGHGEVGLSAADLSDWYAALHTLYHDRSRALRMGALGRQVVCQHYSVEQNALRLADIFKEVACG